MSENWKAAYKVRDCFRVGYNAGVWLADHRGYNVKSGDGLKVKDKLFRHGISADPECCVSNDAHETTSHLFQQCKYTRLIVVAVCSWLHIPEPTSNGIIWLGRRNWLQMKKQICLAVIMATYYAVWQQRNKAWIEGILKRLEVLITQI
ncbi:uncharacterized protein LOC141657230 [Silene latifolia]|uniref:uncharacterized protein LOC141657230 n=1 Tax=Silene latifolia TaxID=37657 RepID=UPI003D775B16